MIHNRFLKAYKVVRQSGAGQYVEGYFNPGRSQSFFIMGSIQPMSARERLLLSDGDRVREVRKIYLESKLFVGSEEELKASDLIFIGCEAYEVRSVEDWTDHLTLRHYKATLVRDNRNDEPLGAA